MERKNKESVFCPQYYLCFILLLGQALNKTSSLFFFHFLNKGFWQTFFFGSSIISMAPSPKLLLWTLLGTSFFIPLLRRAQKSPPAFSSVCFINTLFLFFCFDPLKKATVKSRWRSRKRYYLDKVAK